MTLTLLLCNYVRRKENNYYPTSRGPNRVFQRDHHPSWAQV